MTPEDVRRFRSKVQSVEGEGCWLWRGGIGTGGYGVFWMDGRQHRATHVALAIDGRPLKSDRPFALHHCDTPGCVRPNHLYWGTHDDNMTDRRVRGRTARGDRMPHARVHGSAHPKAKLTEDDVRAIRTEYRPGLGGVLMRRYGISQASLWAIVNRRTWKSVA